MADKKLGEVRTQFVKKVNKAVIHAVLDDLLQEEVLNEEEVERVKEKSAVTHEQARTLIDYVRKKGSDASLIAVKSINSRDAFLAGQLSLTAFLGASGNLPAQSLPAPILPVEETQPVQSRQGIKLCPQKRFEKIQKEKSDKIYPIIRDSEKRTRLALIICNIEFECDYFGRRDGSEVDMAGMECLLTGLGYQVLSKTNLCSKGMTDCLKDFASREEHKTSDSTFVVLISHGVRAGLCGVKSEETKEGFSDILSHDTIYSILNNQNCPALRDKPKVIIIQACRGENKGIIYVSDAAVSTADSISPTPWLQEEYENDSLHCGAVVSSADSVSPVPWLPEEYESDAKREEHVESDLICFCSTTPDNVSWRNSRTGSIFIVQLIEHMQEHAWRYPLEEIFRMVQQAFKNNPRQMPTKERATLLKRFYLFPGH